MLVNVSQRALPDKGFLGGSVVKNPPANAGDVGLIPGSGRSPGEGNSKLLQSGEFLSGEFLSGAFHAQRSLVDCIVHGVVKELDTTEQLTNNK